MLYAINNKTNQRYGKEESEIVKNFASDFENSPLVYLFI